MRAWIAVDEALYRLEAPYYRARAGGRHFTITPEWRRQRDLLTAAWHSLWRRLPRASASGVNIP